MIKFIIYYCWYSFRCDDVSTCDSSVFLDICSFRNLQNNKRFIGGADHIHTPMPKSITNLLTFQEYLKSQNLENINVSNTWRSYVIYWLIVHSCKTAGVLGA
jgi:hypothetical protein